MGSGARVEGGNGSGAADGFLSTRQLSAGDAVDLTIPIGLPAALEALFLE